MGPPPWRAWIGFYGGDEEEEEAVSGERSGRERPLPGGGRGCRCAAAEGG